MQKLLEISDIGKKSMATESNIFGIFDLVISKDFENVLREILDTINCSNKFFIINFFKKYRFYGKNNLEEKDKIIVYNFFDKLEKLNFKDSEKKQFLLDLKNYIFQELLSGEDLIQYIKSHLYEILNQDSKNRLLHSNAEIISNHLQYDLGDIGEIQGYISSFGYIYGEKGISKINPNTFELEYTTGNLGIGKIIKLDYPVLKKINRKRYEYIFGEYGFAIIDPKNLDVRYSSGDLGIGNIYNPANEYREEWQKNYGELTPFKDGGFIMGNYGIAQIDKKTGEELIRISYHDYVGNKTENIDDLVELEIKKHEEYFELDIIEGKKANDFLKKVFDLEVEIFNGNINYEEYKAKRHKIIYKYIGVDASQNISNLSKEKRENLFMTFSSIIDYLDLFQKNIIPLLKIGKKDLEMQKDKVQRIITVDRYKNSNIVEKFSIYDDKYRNIYNEDLREFNKKINDFFDEKKGNSEIKEEQEYEYGTYIRLNAEYAGNGIFVVDKKYFFRIKNGKKIDLPIFSEIFKDGLPEFLYQHIDFNNSIVMNNNGNFYKIDFNTGKLIKKLTKKDLGGKITTLFYGKKYFYGYINKGLEFGIIKIDLQNLEVLEEVFFDTYLNNKKRKKIFLNMKMYFDKKGIYFFDFYKNFLFDGEQNKSIINNFVNFEEINDVIINEIKNTNIVNISNYDTLIPYFKSIVFKAYFGNRIGLLLNIITNDFDLKILIDIKKLRNGEIDIFIPPFDRKLIFGPEDFQLNGRDENYLTKVYPDVDVLRKI